MQTTLHKRTEHADWLSRMEMGSKIWANMLSNSISTGQARRQEEGVVETFPEWRGCWGCVHNDTDHHCCSGRGDCRMGLCMCREGAFGMDCAHEAEARSTQAATTETAAARVPPGLRIYVHEMPFELGQTWLAGVALPRAAPVEPAA